MKNLKIKIIGIILAVIIILASIPLISQAAGSFTASISKTTVTVGDTFTVKVSANTAAGTYSVSPSNSNVTITTSGTGFLDNSSETWTFKASKAGTVTITAKTLDMTDNDDDTKSITGSKTFTVTVKDKETNTSGGSSSESNSGSNSGENSNSGGNTTTPTPKFTTVNETVYAASDVNVRKSYSTSSSIVGSLEKGESVKRTGIGDNGWSKVKYNGQTAYVYSEYLTKTKPVVEKPKEEPENTNTTSNEIKNETKPKNEVNNTVTNNVVENNTVDNNTNNEALRLSKLEIAGVNFTDGFNPETYSYELKLNFFVKELNLTAVANKEDAKIEIIGNKNFKEGENNITILVKSADEKETVTYQIKVVVPSEVENNPQNSLQFYLICGGIILAAIVSIIVVIAIYKGKNKEITDEKEEKDYYKLKIDEQYNDEEKPRRPRGKHSN